MNSEKNNWSFRAVLAHLLGSFDSTQKRHRNVENHDVWMKPLRGFHRGLAVTDCSHDCEIGFQQGNDGIKHSGMIVSNQYSSGPTFFLRGV